MAAISTYKTDLEDQLKGGVKLDENYHNLQAKAAENLTENFSYISATSACNFR